MFRHLITATALLVLATAGTACGASTAAVVPPADAPSADGAVAAQQVQADDASAAEDEVLGELEVRGVDLGFEPSELSVPQPGTYQLTFINDGEILHDLVLPDGTKLVADPGERASELIEVGTSGLSFICSIPGHEEAGMTGTITVAGETSETAGDDHSGPAPASALAPNPEAPEYTLYDAELGPARSGTTHEIDLVIEEKLMTVAPGIEVMAWTFGGTVPGPVIRVRVGDTVRVRLKNPASSELAHSVDFHASQVAWNDEMTSINPGEEKIYEFTADYAGVWMYHCGTAPALHHIANGMFGMVIVEPEEGLPPVDHEFGLVQSEWYLAGQQEPASLTKAAAAAPAPEYVVFNGVANQYKDNPLQVETGSRVRTFVLNAGPSVDSSFHIVGTIFDTVIKEGIQLTPDNPGRYGSQAVDLAPAQGAIIEFTTAEDGLYPIVTHAFNFVGRGALGLVQAGDGDPLD